jgi:hypothetical protein
LRKAAKAKGMLLRRRKSGEEEKEKRKSRGFAAEEEAEEKPGTSSRFDPDAAGTNLIPRTSTFLERLSTPSCDPGTLFRSW